MRWTSAGAAAPPRRRPRLQLHLWASARCGLAAKLAQPAPDQQQSHCVLPALINSGNLPATLGLFGRSADHTPGSCFVANHRMWCPSGSIWHPKMCRTNAISARPCVPGGGASVMLGLSSIVSVFTVEVIHWQSDCHSEMDAMEGSIMPSGVLGQWMLIRVLPCRIIPGSLPVSIWPHSGWTFTQSAWTPISGSVLGNPAVPRLCLSRTCWPHKLLCSFKFGRQQIFLRQEMNFLLLVLNYPIVGASLAVAVLSWPCQCPWTTWIHRGGHVLAHPSVIISLSLVWHLPGRRKRPQKWSTFGGKTCFPGIGICENSSRWLDVTRWPLAIWM